MDGKLGVRRLRCNEEEDVGDRRQLDPAGKRKEGEGGVWGDRKDFLLCYSLNVAKSNHGAGPQEAAVYAKYYPFPA